MMLAKTWVERSPALWIWAPDMGHDYRPQGCVGVLGLDDPKVATPEFTRSAPTYPSERCLMSQAHENSHYRELLEGVSPTLVLEEMALIILRDLKLTPQDREALERTVRIARSLRKSPTYPEVKP